MFKRVTPDILTPYIWFEQTWLKSISDATYQISMSLALWTGQVRFDFLGENVIYSFLLLWQPGNDSINFFE